MDLDGEKEIKILKQTITRHSKTYLAKFFNGKTSKCGDGAMPIFETKPCHYFVDRHAKNSEMFFSFLKMKFVKKNVPHSEELEDELEFYGFTNGQDFFKSVDGCRLSWQIDQLDLYHDDMEKSDLITLDLNGEKQIKILKKTLKKQPSTVLACYFSGDCYYLTGLEFIERPYNFPICKTQPGHYFVDRPSERSETVFNLLKGALVKQSGEIKRELALYGYILNEHYFETGPNNDLLSITRTT